MPKLGGKDKKQRELIAGLEEVRDSAQFGAIRRDSARFGAILRNSAQFGAILRRSLRALRSSSR